MIVVRVELWPGGDARRAREIATAFISNESGLADISSYRAGVKELESEVTGLPSQQVRLLIERHDRRSSVWSLISRVAQLTAQHFMGRIPA